MADKPKDNRRYFAQVGSELIELSAEDVEAHAKGARFSTSAPIAHYRVRVTSDSATFEGIGDSWKDAEAAADKQLPKESK